MVQAVEALSALSALSNSEKAADMARYHKAARDYLGVSNPQIDTLVKEWRSVCDVEQRVSLAAGLWDSNVHEARIAAAKLLTQARLKPDADAWDEIKRWVPSFDGWAVADHACSAGARRLTAKPDRLDEVELWTTNPNMWVRRAALIMTLPWSKMNNLKPEQITQRDRVLDWAASYVDDQEWFIQKAIGWWLRSLSKHDPERVRIFLDHHSGGMKNFAVKEASKYLNR